MKKFLLGLVLMLALFTVGCEKVEEGNYKEGTYLGVVDTVDGRTGAKYVTTALVNVDEKGLIENVFIDVTYTTKDGVNTTKKVLGDAYGMAKEEGQLEWFEQAKAIEDKVVAEQGLEWLTYTDEAKTETDTISGVTITVDKYHAAILDALTQAKK
jgi:major membrane immunogen (membrane-anchored lipoprotein)